MQTVNQRLQLVHAHVEKVRRTRPAIQPGEKFATAQAIFYDDSLDAVGIINSHLDECVLIEECIQELQRQKKAHAQACFEQFGLNPRIFNGLLKACKTKIIDEIRELTEAATRVFAERPIKEEDDENGTY